MPVHRAGPQGSALGLARLFEFLRMEAAGGLMLGAAAAVGMLWANSRGGALYHAILAIPIAVSAGDLSLAKPLLLWINDGLMAIFFLLVGLEIKREIVDGELSTRERALLPAIAALGGMIVPALIYAGLNYADPVTIRGWAIPAATDIAFALGVIGLLGDRVPPGLKILLSALAIIDDLGAIVLIALFYSSDLSMVSLALAGVGLLVLAALNRCGVSRLGPYVLTGIFLWVCVLESGVHATLAGVALAFAIPIAGDDKGNGPLYRLEHALHGWVSYAILPLFALANAGVSLSGVGLATLTGALPLGVAAGLAIGKPIGVISATLIALRLKIARLPQGVTWPQLCGMALLTGIGFTMSLFIGTLAFESVVRQTEVRIGVIAGSLVSALLGSVVLRLATARNSAPSAIRHDQTGGP